MPQSVGFARVASATLTVTLAAAGLPAAALGQTAAETPSVSCLFESYLGSADANTALDVGIDASLLTGDFEILAGLRGGALAHLASRNGKSRSHVDLRGGIQLSAGLSPWRIGVYPYYRYGAVEHRVDEKTLYRLDGWGVSVFLAWDFLS